MNDPTARFWIWNYLTGYRLPDKVGAVGAFDYQLNNLLGSLWSVPAVPDCFTETTVGSARAWYVDRDSADFHAWLEAYNPQLYREYLALVLQRNL